MKKIDKKSMKDSSNNIIYKKQNSMPQKWIIEMTHKAYATF